MGASLRRSFNGAAARLITSENAYISFFLVLLYSDPIATRREQYVSSALVLRNRHAGKHPSADLNTPTASKFSEKKHCVNAVRL